MSTGGGSVTGDVKVPGWYLVAPRDGGGAERRLADVERRLRRLDTPDPLAQLDRRFGDMTLREMVLDDGQLERMQITISRLEEHFGSRLWLQLGQPIMLDPGAGHDAGYQNRDPEGSDRWIMLVDTGYPNGGGGPAPLDTAVLVYSHAHRGLLAAIDRENPQNPSQVLWYLGSEDFDDCISIVDGVAKFALYGQHGPPLTLDENRQLEIADAPLAAVRGWPELDEWAQHSAWSLASFGRINNAPTANLGGITGVTTPH